MGAAGTDFGIAPELILADQETVPEEFGGGERSAAIRLMILSRQPWLLFHTVRRWLATKDRAFISYAWKDNSHLQVADRLSRSLTSIGITHYYDKFFAEQYAGFSGTCVSLS